MNTSSLSISSYSKAEIVLNIPGQFFFQISEDENEPKFGKNVSHHPKDIEAIKNSISNVFSEIAENLASSASKCPEYYHTIIEKLKRVGYFRQFKFPGLQVINLCSNHLNLFALFPERFLICEKSDGVRYLLIHFNNGKTLFLGRSLEFYLVDLTLKLPVGHMPMPGTKKGDWEIMNFLDGELIVDLVNESSAVEEKGNSVKINNKLYRVKFLVFDAIVLRQINIGNLPFKNRLKELSDFFFSIKNENSFKDARENFFKAFHSSFELEYLETYFQNTLHNFQRYPTNKTFAIDIYMKDYFTLDKINNLSKIAKQLPHDNDGIIINTDDYPYYSGQSTEIYKWKPSHLNTIDFEVNYLQSKNIYVLSVGENNTTIPVSLLFYANSEEEEKFLSGFNQLGTGAKVIECFYDRDFNSDDVVNFNYYMFANRREPFSDNISHIISIYNRESEFLSKIERKKFEKGGWRFLRFRKDKTQGNYLNTYQNVVQVIEENIQIEDIVNKIQENRINPKGKELLEAYNGCCSGCIWKESKLLKESYLDNEEMITQLITKQSESRIKPTKTKPTILLGEKRLPENTIANESPRKRNTSAMKAENNLSYSAPPKVATSNQPVLNKKKEREMKKQEKKQKSFIQARETLELLTRGKTEKVPVINTKTKEENVILKDDELSLEESSENE